MSSSMLESLLETGEYSSGRPGKSYYQKYTYILDNGQIVICIDPAHPNKEHAVNTLAKELVKKYHMLHGRHFIKSVDNNTITITHTGYSFLEERSKNNSELAYAFEITQLLNSLVKKYENTEGDKRKVENIIKSILIDPNPLFKIEQTSKNDIYITVNKKINEPLAKQIRTGIIKIVQFLIKVTPLSNQKELNITETVNISHTKRLKTSVNLRDHLRQYINDGYYITRPLSTHMILHESPHNSHDEYKAANTAFEQLIIGDDLQAIKATLNSFAQLVSNQHTVKDKHIYKKIAFKHILNIFKNLQRIEDISELFMHLLSLQLELDIHRNSFDGLFNKYNTNSWQELLGEIRDDAFLKLEKIVHESERKIEQTDAITLLEKCMHMKLFTKHRTNWIKFAPTQAEQDIYVMLQQLKNVHNTSKPFTNPFNI